MMEMKCLSFGFYSLKNWKPKDYLGGTLWFSVFVYLSICVFVYLYAERRARVKGVDYTKAGGELGGVWGIVTQDWISRS